MVGAGIGVGHLLFNNSPTKKVSYITAVTTGLTKKGDQSQKATITVTSHGGADLNKLKRISNTTDFNFSTWTISPDSATCTCYALASATANVTKDVTILSDDNAFDSFKTTVAILPAPIPTPTDASYGTITVDGYADSTNRNASHSATVYLTLHGNASIAEFTMPVQDGSLLKTDNTEWIYVSNGIYKINVYANSTSAGGDVRMHMDFKRNSVREVDLTLGFTVFVSNGTSKPMYTLEMDGYMNNCYYQVTEKKTFKLYVHLINGTTWAGLGATSKPSIDNVGTVDCDWVKENDNTYYFSGYSDTTSHHSVEAHLRNSTGNLDACIPLYEGYPLDY